MSKKVLVSGIQATGNLHFGNYFGAMKQNINMANSGEYESYIFIADYHALTTVKDGTKLSSSALEIACAYVACGLDLSKAVLFRQSSVKEHTELCVILNNVVTMPYLMRAHAFKDHEAKNKEVNVGLFDYPVLMAADILMYDTQVVPVGEDQRQHIEMAREIGRKFNALYGDTFVEPEALIKKEVAVVPGTDGQKMSKSYKNTIPLFGTDEEIKKAVMGIVTDSSGETPVNVYAIHKLLRPEAELDALYNEKKGKYKDLKEALLVDILALVTPMRERRAYYESHPEIVAEILKKGGEKARAKAQTKMREVREKVGLE